MFIIVIGGDFMTNKNEQVLVLRTVYLNPERDEELRKIAFENRISKGDLIRRLIDFALERKSEFVKVSSPEPPKPKNTEAQAKDKMNQAIPPAVAKALAKIT